MEGALGRVFTPEFMGRLDRIVHFDPLQENAMGAIVRKYLCQLCARVDEQGIKLALPEELAENLARISRGKGGARSLRRLVQEKVEGPLAAFMLQNCEKPGKIIGFWQGEKMYFQI